MLKFLYASNFTWSDSTATSVFLKTVRLYTVILWNTYQCYYAYNI
jgi:hypothetical protein